MMKKEIRKFYSSPETVIVEVNSEQAFLASSNLINYSFGGVDNEAFTSGGTFSDWK